MRILVIGGKANSLLNFRGDLIREMVRRGHEVVAMAPDADADIQRGLEALGATFRQVPLARTGLNPLRDLADVVGMVRIFRREKADLIFAYTPKPVIFGLLAAWMAGIPRRFAMITGRGTPLMAPKGSLLRAGITFLYRLALVRVHGVVFQNHDDAAFFLEEGMLRPATPRVVVSGSGVDVAWFAQVPLPAGPPVFLFLGRMLRDKGIQDYLQACCRLTEAGVPARFLAMGGLDSNPSALSAEQLKAGCAAGSVEYLAEVTDVRPTLTRAHILVLPSRGEGTPRVVLEAMAMGRAIVTTDAPGCRETVEDGISGFLVPVGDVEALAAAMAKLARDPDLLAAFGREGRRIAVAKYEVGLVSAEVLAFLGLPTPGAVKVP